MNTSFCPVVNIADLETEPFKHGQAYESSDAGISEAVGLTQIGAALTEVPPGKSACPFHVHHIEDEMFFILEGTGEYRFGDQTYAVKTGDVLGAPRGRQEFAHKLTNTGTGMLRYLSISSKADTDVCEYPDSGKFMVMSRRSADTATRFRFIGSLEDGRDYWDGEDSD
jgi:uncharacterized cupin superfamily protein